VERKLRIRAHWQQHCERNQASLPRIEHPAGPYIAPRHLRRQSLEVADDFWIDTRAG